MNVRFRVDFNEWDNHTNRVRIWDGNTKHLQPGLEITLYDNDGLEVEAIAAFDEEHQFWYGLPDWSTRRDVPLPPIQSEHDE